MKLIKAIIKTYRQADKLEQLLVKWIISMIPFITGIALVDKYPNSNIVCGIAIIIVLPFWFNLAKILLEMIKEDFEKLIENIRNNMEE